MNVELMAEARGLSEQLIAWRRHLHAHPELSGHEQLTAQFIARELRALGYEPVERANGGHGLFAELRVDDRAPFTVLRADIDALPIQEETAAPYASINPGVMHACGHDAHAAMLLGAARLLRARKSSLKRNVRLIFQPHEELFPGGAPDMIAAGALAQADQIFGIHISSMLPTGQVGSRSGAFMAAVDTFRAIVHGRGGHAAMPELCVDPIVAAAEIITALQTIVSRNITITEPAVVSVTQIQAGTADNVIPPSVEFGGTIRTFSRAVRELVARRVEQIAAGIAEAHQARAEVSVTNGYPVVVNDDELTRRAFESARRLGFQEDQIRTLPPIGGGEDFAYYCEKLPGNFVFLGAASEASHSTYPHHHPKFDVDEQALALGAALHTQFALDAQPR